MKKLNQYLFKKRSASYLKSTNRIRRFVNYETANTVLLLFESDYIEKNRYIRKVIGQLVNDGKKVYAWGYINNKKATRQIGWLFLELIPGFGPGTSSLPMTRSTS